MACKIVTVYLIKYNIYTIFNLSNITWCFTMLEHQSLLISVNDSLFNYYSYMYLLPQYCRVQCCKSVISQLYGFVYADREPTIPVFKHQLTCQEHFKTFVFLRWSWDNTLQLTAGLWQYQYRYQKCMLMMIMINATYKIEMLSNLNLKMWKIVILIMNYEKCSQSPFQIFNINQSQ